jgi:type IV pilus assembly protein PilO
VKKISAPKLAFKLPQIDFRRLADDFRTLDPKDPGLWPLVPKVVILLGTLVALIVAGAWFGWREQLDELER